jgi:hypothetical protein
MRRSVSLAAAGVLLAVFGGTAGCASRPAAEPRQPAAQATRSTHPAGQAAPVSIKLTLVSRTVVAGGQIAGRVKVINNSGHAIHLAGCNALFTVALASHSYHPVIAVATCLQRLTIPAGTSRYRVQVLASYLSCSVRHATAGTPACLPGMRMPPLPPGSYRATLYFLVTRFAPAPAPIPVQVTR